MSLSFNIVAKHRWKILGGWLMVETIGIFAAFPAMANLTERVILGAPQIVIVNPISSQDGVTQFSVSSNAAFAVISTGQLGEYTVVVSQYGENAQSVGDAHTCGVTLTNTPTRIYTAKRKTAARRGSVESQSVRITISHDPDLRTQFEIVAMGEAPAMLATPCTTGHS